ncbi:hypothetical protein KI387_003367 [Taxus chinensis]|uniref:WRKY domain-containing protein n=1 Tax=Taxus chinensis TaxID=29808 RepID=A0AA38GYG3_TAXCH|nr:hypothetical protein KI387_003367 [Taxus chinensis]
MEIETIFNFPLYHGVENYSLDELSYSETRQSVKNESHLGVVKEQTKPYALNLKRINDNAETESVEPSDFLVSSEGEGEDDSSAGATELQRRIVVKPHDLDGTSLEPQSDESLASPTHFEHQFLTRKKRKRNSEKAPRYVFKTKSEADILEDGYKWRKYGKKYIKNTPNPRNYYRCSAKNCNVKKRVERDAVDKGIVITTYEGKHNHQSPSLVYYIEKPSLIISQQSSLHQHVPFFYTPGPEERFMFMNTS